jgi:hypothetical protein
MEKHGHVNAILWIALLFTVITSVVSLINRLSVLILSHGEIVLSNFIKMNILWIIVVVAIIITLVLNIKNSEQPGFLDILQNENIRITTGILVALQGLISLSNALPNYIMSIQTLYRYKLPPSVDLEILIRKPIIIDVISLVIILCQISLGVYLAKCYKKR